MVREREFRKEGEKDGRENDERGEKLKWGRGCEGERVGGGGGVPRKRQEKMGWKGEMTRWNRVVRKMIHPYS